MTTQKTELGNLESVHTIAPVFLQRAAIVAVTSFIFFLLMLVAFSVWQKVGYFMLATAFLIVEIFTMIGWFTQRGTEFKIYENGFIYKKRSNLWSEIKSVFTSRKNKYEIILNTGEKFVLTEMIQNVEEIIKRIETEIAQRT
jgi:hypothetical protein